jgi:hypothetical protein
MSCKLYIDKYSDNSEVVTKLGDIHDRIIQNIEKTGYFKKEGNKYLLPRTGSIRYESAKDAINIINRQYGVPVVGINTKDEQHRAYVNVVNLVPGVTNDVEKLQMENESVDMPVEKDYNTTKILNGLSVKFGVQWTIDNKQDMLGRFDNGVVYINMTKVKPDTPFHEFAHPFEQTIKKQNYQLWKSLADRAKTFTYKGQNIMSYVAKLYPELSPNELQSEAIVTSIGLAATDPTGFKEQAPVKSFIRDFIDWVRSFFNQNNETVRNLSLNTTIRDLADMMLDDQKINLDNSAFSTAHQKTSMNTGEGIKTLKDLNQNIEIVEEPAVDPKAQNDSFYKRKDKSTKFERVTHFTTKTFSSESKREKLNKYSPAEWLTRKYYEKYNVKFTDQIKWEESGQMISYDDLLQIMQNKVTSDAKQGSLLHAKIESYINPSKELDAKIRTLMQETQTDANKYKWLSDSKVFEILRGLELNVGTDYENSPVADKIESELKITSDLMGIGSTIDMLAEHSNGAFSMYDFKTGEGLLKDYNSVDIMKYGELPDEDVFDNRLSHAKLELALRAVMIKEQKPDARFRQIAVVHLDKTTEPSVFEVSLHNYLQMIDQHFANTDPQKHEEMKKKGLFDANNYTSTTSTTEKIMNRPDMKDKTMGERADMIMQEVEQLYNKYKAKNKPIPDYINEQIAELTQAAYEMRGLSNSEAISDAKDMGTFEKWLGTYQDISNPTLQRFFSLVNGRKYKAQQEFIKSSNRNKQLVTKLTREHQFSKTSNLISPKALVYYTGDKNNPGLYDFMWERKEMNGVNGLYAAKYEASDVGKTITPTQYEYYKFFHETIKGATDAVMNQTAYNGLTKGQMMSFQYYDGFMPRIPMTLDEIIERHGYVSKEVGKKLYDKHLKLLEAERAGFLRNNAVGIPIKYVGSKAIVASDSFSANCEEMLSLYTQNMLQKQYLDPVYAFGKGTLTYLKTVVDPRTGEPTMTENIDFLNRTLEADLMGNKQDPKFLRKDIGIGGKKVNVGKVFRGANNVVSASTMWFSPVSAFFSGMNQMFLDLKRATVGSLVKNSDFSLNSYRKGWAIYLNEGILGKNNEFKDEVDLRAQSKIYKWSELMQFDTTVYKGSREKKGIVSAKARLLTQSTMFLPHSFSEEATLLSTMAAILSEKKVNTELDESGKWLKEIKQDGSFVYTDKKEDAMSFYDVYKQNKDTGELEYKGPERGKLATGEVITGLTSDEIARMKRVTQKLHGSYREDERSKIGQTVIGQWLMKFRKYIPVNLADNFAGLHKDFTLGKYEKLYNPDGSARVEDGQTLYEWQAQVNEGRMRVVSKVMVHYMSSVINKDNPAYKDYALKNLSDEQRKQLYDAAVALVMMGLSAILRHQFYDDDKDKDREGYKRWVRLEQDLIQIHPSELLRPLQSPLMQVNFIQKAFDSVCSYIWDSWNGGVVKTGKHAGMKHGEAFLRRYTPIWNLEAKMETLGEITGFSDPEE